MKRTLLALTLLLTTIGSATTVSCKTEQDPDITTCCGNSHQHWAYCCNVNSTCVPDGSPGHKTPEQCEAHGYGSDTGGGTGQTETGSPCVGDHCTIDVGSAVDSTGAGCDNFTKYRCRGWKAAVYKNNALRRFDFSGGSFPNGDKYARCESFEICMDYVGEADNETLFMACADQAEESNDWTPPAHPYTGTVGELWTLDHIEYVFAEQAGYAVIAGVTGDFYDSGCSWIPTNSTDPKDQQCTGGDCVSPEECPAMGQSCVGWDPGSKITSSLNTSTRTYTTTINKVWLTALADDFFDAIPVCDSGSWTWSTSATPDKWRMQDLVSRDFMYKLGFRNNDEQIRIKKAGTETWYNLYGSTMEDGYAAMADALAIMFSGTSFVLEFKRPVGGTLVTYTMNLSLT